MKLQHLSECVCERHTQILRLITAISTVVLLIAQQTRIDTVSVCTAELGRHLTGDVHCSNK